MTVYTALPADDLNLAVEVTESNDMVTINITPAIVNTGGGGVTSVDTGSGLTGGPITNTGTIAIDATVATLTGAQALSNKTGLISQWTNDSGYTTATGDVTLTGTQTLTNKTLTSPVLGGTTTSASGNIVLDPASQILEVKGGGADSGAILLNCYANTHGQTLKSQPHDQNITNTMLLPQGADSTLVSEATFNNLTDLHLNTNTASASEILSWTGTDYTWITQSGGGGSTTINNNADNRIITGSNTANTLEGEANFTWDGTNALISGTASNLTAPVLKLETSNSNWNAPQLLCADSNGNVFSQVGRHNTTNDLYQWNITLDPDNTNGRSGVTTFAGDYFVSFEKNYSTASDIRMDMNVYGAHNAFNINVRDDYNNGGGNQYGLRPLNLNALETNINAGTNGDLVFTADGTGITFGDGSYTFPLSDGTANQVLQTNGAGVISFATVSGGGGATDLNGLSDVDIVSVSDGDILRYNGTATKWQNTNLGLTLTPIVTLNSSFYASAEAVATITNWSSYTDPNVFAQVEDYLGNIIITNAQISAGIDLTAGTVTFNVGTTIATGYKLKVRVQDFGDLASDTAENTFLVEAVTVNSTFRYYRMQDWSGLTDVGSLPTSGNRVMVGTFRLWSATGGTGTQYPPDMTSDTLPTPNVALASRLFASYPYWKAFDNQQNTSFWWNLGDTPAQALAAWLQIDLGASYNIRSIQIAQGQIGYGFTGAKVYGSDTGVFGGEEALVLDATGLLNPWTSTSNFILG